MPTEISTLLMLVVAPQAVVSPVASPPASWIAYAELVQYDLKVWIEQSDDPAAVRVRSALQTRYSTNAESEIRVKIWGDATGTITRARFPDDPALDADLQSAIVGRTLDEAPPPGLRWPITLALRGIPVIGAGKSTAPTAQPQ